MDRTSFLEYINYQSIDLRKLKISITREVKEDGWIYLKREEKDFSIILYKQNKEIILKKVGPHKVYNELFKIIQKQKHNMEDSL